MLSPTNINVLSKLRDVLVDESDRIEERLRSVATGDNADLEESQSATLPFNPSTAQNGFTGHMKRQETKACRFCYSEEPNGEWLSPCKCSGSIKYVHSTCFYRWLASAPLLQQAQCTTCKYVYTKTWKLKPYEEWCLPDLKSVPVEVVQVTFDVICTYRLVSTCKDFFSGRRSLLAILAGFSFWRLFVMTDRRIMYWTNLFQCFASSVFHFTVVDAPS